MGRVSASCVSWVNMQLGWVRVKGKLSVVGGHSTRTGQVACRGRTCNYSQVDGKLRVNVEHAIGSKKLHSRGKQTIVVGVTLAVACVMPDMQLPFNNTNSANPYPTTPSCSNIEGVQLQSGATLAVASQG